MAIDEGALEKWDWEYGGAQYQKPLAFGNHRDNPWLNCLPAAVTPLWGCYETEG